MEKSKESEVYKAIYNGCRGGQWTSAQEIFPFSPETLCRNEHPTAGRAMLVPTLFPEIFR